MHCCTILTMEILSFFLGLSRFTILLCPIKCRKCLSAVCNFNAASLHGNADLTEPICGSNNLDSYRRNKKQFPIRTCPSFINCRKKNPLNLIRWDAFNRFCSIFAFLFLHCLSYMHSTACILEFTLPLYINICGNDRVCQLLSHNDKKEMMNKYKWLLCNCVSVLGQSQLGKFILKNVLTEE